MRKWYIAVGEAGFYVIVAFLWFLAFLVFVCAFAFCIALILL